MQDTIKLILWISAVLLFTFGAVSDIVQDVQHAKVSTAHVAQASVPERIYCSGETAPDWHTRIEVFGEVQGSSVTGAISLRGSSNPDLRMPATGYAFRAGGLLSLVLTWNQPELGYYPIRTLAVQGQPARLSGQITYYPLPSSEDNKAKKPTQQVERLSCLIYEV